MPQNPQQTPVQSQKGGSKVRHSAKMKAERRSTYARAGKRRARGKK